MGSKDDAKREEIFQKVRRLVAKQLGAKEEDITEDTNFVEDLKADSLDLVELVMVLEEEFSKNGQIIEISDEDAEKITTVRQAVDLILEHLD
jgi:acyl carrier protein